MPVLPYLGKWPTIAPDVYIADGAMVIGDVSIAEGSSIWFNVVVRADVAPIKIGRRVNVQDGAVLHADPSCPVEVGDDCTLGHRAVVHGAVVEEGCLIGIGAIVLNHVVVGAGSVIGSGSVVAERQRIPPRSLVLGVPGRVVKELTPEQAALPLRAAQAYVRHGQEYRSQRVGADTGSE